MGRASIDEKREGGHGSAGTEYYRPGRNVRRGGDIPSPIQHGCNLRRPLTFATRNGFSVETRRRTGEKVLRHPLTPRPVVVNGRRKDATRAVISFIHKFHGRVL